MNAAVSNPLVRISASIPPATLRGASIAGRVFGAALALLVAFDQSYDPTQAFTAIAAGLVLTTLVQVRGAWGDVLAAFGAGLVFFSGTVLTHFQPGIGMLAVGLLAGLATFTFAYRLGRDATLPAVAFIGAALVTAPLQAAIVFAFE